MQDYSFFSERILRTTWGRSRIVIIVLLIIVVSLLVKMIYYWRTKSNKGVSIWSFLLRNTTYSPRLPTLKQQIGFSIVGIILLLIVAITSLRSAYRDINYTQYVRIETQYSREATRDDGNIFSYGRVYVKTGDTWISLNLPYDWTYEEFPLGEFNGIIWYSEEARIILNFTPQ